MATGQTRTITGIAPKKSAIPGKIPTGTTIGEIFSNLPDKKLFGYDGSNIFEYGSSSYLGLTGGTISGNVTSFSLSSTTLSGDTLYSGSTELSTIINAQINANQTFVQPGTNTYTGGTSLRPTVNISALTINTISVSGESYFTGGLSANTLSGGTIYSGASDVSTLFATPANITLINSQLATKANLSGATFTGTINGATIVGTTVYGTTLSGNTLYSGASDVSTLFATPANITLINSQLATKANLSGVTFTGTVTGGNIAGSTVFGTILSGNTLYSGASNVSLLFGLAALVGTHSAQLLTKANLSGATFTGQVNTPILSATTISATTAITNNNYTSGALTVGANSNNGDFVQFTDTFDGTVFNTSNWTATGVVTQNNDLSISGISNWTSHGITSTQAYDRTNTLTLMMDVIISCSQGVL